jgi:hypothetical protein
MTSSWMSKWRQECDKRLAVPPDRHTYSFERCVDRMSACSNNHPLGNWCNFFESTYTEDEDLLAAFEVSATALRPNHPQTLQKT